MSKYLSQQKVWLTATDKLRSLDDKDVLFVQGTSQWEAHFRVDSADPNSPERGKIAVMAWQVVVSGADEPWEEVQMIPVSPPKQYDTSHWERSLTQETLDLMRPAVPTSLSA